MTDHKPLTDEELTELERKYARSIEVGRLLSELRSLRAEKVSPEERAYLDAVGVRMKAEAMTGPGMFAWAARAEDAARKALKEAMKP